jgi:hypothetical protein
MANTGFVPINVSGTEDGSLVTVSKSYLNGIKFLDVIVLYCPVIISITLLILSCYNQNPNVIFFLSFIIVFSTLRRLFIDNNTNNNNNNNRCRTDSYTEGMILFFITFTYGYMIAPMIIIKKANVPIIIVLTLYLIVVYVYLITNNCLTLNNLFFNFIYSILSVIMCVYMLLLSNNSILLYTDDLTDGTICSMPSKQQFKCVVRQGSQNLDQN